MNIWLRNVAGILVERHPTGSPGPVDLSAPPKGVLHTTEGSFESALSVFERENEPTFMVGADKRGKVRILQFMPLGMMAAALENHRGGVETNRLVRAQIEIVGKSETTLWLPDKPVAAALAELMYALSDLADIPYRRAIANRDPRAWTRASGWLGHEDVPENVHWDPGNLNFPALLALAGEPAEDPYWLWLRWNLGEKEFRPFGPRNMKHRPTILPGRVPQAWWARAEAFVAAREHSD